MTRAVDLPQRRRRTEPGLGFFFAAIREIRVKNISDQHSLVVGLQIHFQSGSLTCPDVSSSSTSANMISRKRRIFPALGCSVFRASASSRLPITWANGRRRCERIGYGDRSVISFVAASNAFGVIAAYRWRVHQFAKHRWRHARMIVNPATGEFDRERVAIITNGGDGFRSDGDQFRVHQANITRLN